MMLTNHDRWKRLLVMGLSLILTFSSCSKDENDSQQSDEVVVIDGNGDIAASVNEFRQLLGAQLNTAPGATGGRREINWEGVPDDLLNQRLPGNFFNPTEPGANVANQRGLIYSAAGNFQVSKTNFSEVNAKAADQFAAFSGNKIFANTGSNLWDVEFQVAGQAVAARVQGFGIVFSDVDLSNKTFLEFFRDDKSLGQFFVPAHSAGSSFSFLGVYFKNDFITRVRVGHEGKLVDGEDDISEGGPLDLVAMDDFLYSEPVQK